MRYRFTFLTDETLSEEKTMTKGRVNSRTSAVSGRPTQVADKVLVWLHGEDSFAVPPWSKTAYIEAATLLRRVQLGELLSMPASRPMPIIGRKVHELRVKDEGAEWRIVYRLDPDAVVIVEVFNKETRDTPRRVVETCQRRLREYDKAAAPVRTAKARRR